MIGAATRVAAVIGHPIQHSLSPVLHNAGFASLGVDWVYTAFDVAPGQGAAAVAAMRTLGLGGLSVTMPHKQEIARAVDVLDPAARALDSVNTVSWRDDGALVGHSTDGAGFVASLAAAGHGVTGTTVCVLGAGGAGRSIIDALARAGAAAITVVNRTEAAAHAAAQLGGSIASVGAVAAVTDADIVVNTTSVGMGDGRLPCDPGLLRAGQVVVDIVYRPRFTPWLRAAQAVGAVTVDGLGMLIHQAVLQEQIWLGRLPDLAAMTAAAHASLPPDP